MKSAVLEEFGETAVLSIGGIGENSDEWRAGYAKGLEQGTQDAKARAIGLADDLVQSIQDVSFGYAEAKADLLTQLEPLFGALIQGLIPSMIEDVFFAEIQDVLMEQSRRALDVPLKLALSPAQTDAVRDVLIGLPNLSVQVASDAGLSENEAIISASEHEVMVDLAGAGASLQRALESITSEYREGRRHG